MVEVTLSFHSPAIMALCAGNPPAAEGTGLRTDTTRPISQRSQQLGAARWRGLPTEQLRKNSAARRLRNLLRRSDRQHGRRLGAQSAFPDAYHRDRKSVV